MKQKLILLTLVTVLGAGTLKAQKFSFGIDPGVSFSKCLFSPAAGVDFKYKLGFDGGVFADYAVSPMFALQLEANYSQGGAKVSSGDQSGNINFDYFTVPLLAKVKAAPGFSVFAGPQIGFLTTANIKVSGMTQDLKPALKSSDIFAVFGAEYQLPVGVSIGVRYNLGLQNIISEDATEGDIKNRGFALRVGYVFKTHTAPAKKK